MDGASHIRRIPVSNEWNHWTRFGFQHHFVGAKSLRFINGRIVFFSFLHFLVLRSVWYFQNEKRKNKLSIFHIVWLLYWNNSSFCRFHVIVFAPPGVCESMTLDCVSSLILTQKTALAHPKYRWYLKTLQEFSLFFPIFLTR